LRWLREEAELEDEAMTTEQRAPTEEEMMQRLTAVEDPELRMSIVDLGLIYGVEYAEGKVTVTMTLTSPGCPMGGVIETQIYHILKSLPSVEDVEVKMTFTPHWDPRTMATDDVKMMLGIY
jgi:metal-sulfur cluster biosynthetic enzyme